MADSDKGSSYRLQTTGVAKLSLFEKLGIIPILFRILGNTFVSTIAGLLRSKKSKPSTLWRYIGLSRLRTVVGISSLKQLHTIIPPTYTAYAAACKNNGQEVRRELLADGTAAFWVGQKNTEKVVLHFHGGGYNLPQAIEQFEFMFRALKQFKDQGIENISFLCLSYDLTPEAKYPRQLEQAAAMLNYALNDLHYSPEQIIVTGDSAGANLILSLLSHVLHPHPSASVPRVTLTTPLLGVLLICPWVSFSMDSPSWKENVHKDCIGPGAVKWADSFAPPAVRDNYNEPVRAPTGWWVGFPASNVLVLAGGDEVLLDGINEFSEKLEKDLQNQDVKFQYIVAPNEYHDQWYLDMQMGYTKESDESKQAKVIKEFIRSKL